MKKILMLMFLVAGCFPSSSPQKAVVKKQTKYVITSNNDTLFVYKAMFLNDSVAFHFSTYEKYDIGDYVFRSR